jgi:hypothetical protein
LLARLQADPQQTALTVVWLADGGVHAGGDGAVEKDENQNCATIGLVFLLS